MLDKQPSRVYVCISVIDAHGEQKAVEKLYPIKGEFFERILIESHKVDVTALLTFTIQRIHGKAIGVLSINLFAFGERLAWFELSVEDEYRGFINDRVNRASCALSFGFQRVTIYDDFFLKIPLA